MVQAENRSTMVQDENKNSMVVAIALRMCGYLLIGSQKRTQRSPGFPALSLRAANHSQFGEFSNPIFLRFSLAFS
jgi:hypothetical protein